MRGKRLRALSLIIALSASSLTLAAERDEKLLASARTMQPALIESLREMVLIESGSTDEAGLRRMSDYVEKRLRLLGANVERTAATVGPGEIVKGR